MFKKEYISRYTNLESSIESIINHSVKKLARQVTPAQIFSFPAL